MVLKEIRWYSEDLIYLAEDREKWWVFVNMVMNLQLP
jgi:hypothetical protein